MCIIYWKLNSIGKYFSDILYCALILRNRAPAILLNVCINTFFAKHEPWVFNDARISYFLRANRTNSSFVNSRPIVFVVFRSFYKILGLNLQILFCLIPLREVPLAPFHAHKQDKNTVLLKQHQKWPFFVGFIRNTLFKLV